MHVQPRVHVVTIHWGSADWVRLQQTQLARHLDTTRVSLHLGIGGGVQLTDPALRNWHQFDEFNVITVEGRHAQNLDGVIARAATGIASEDLLLVLDQDAFPIRPLRDLVTYACAEDQPIAAVRTENNGDEQPHPLFCLLPFALWLRLAGTWAEGPVRVVEDGHIRRDVGGQFLQQLNKADQEWVRLRRSADLGDHPVLYGVYGDVVYHHGAASRPVWTDVDATRVYRNVVHRVGDGVLYRLPITRYLSRREREQGRLAAGHHAMTARLMEDPDDFMFRNGGVSSSVDD